MTSRYIGYKPSRDFVSATPQAYINMFNDMFTDLDPKGQAIMLQVKKNAMEIPAIPRLSEAGACELILKTLAKVNQYGHP